MAGDVANNCCKICAVSCGVLGSLEGLAASSFTYSVDDWGESSSACFRG
jgi:hypothetical protein